MHPTLAIGLVVLTWLVVHRRSTSSRVLLAIAAVLLGWEPASTGDRVGAVLLLVAAGVIASLVWDRVVSVGGAAEAPVVQPSQVIELPRPIAVERPAEPGPPGEPITELDQADAYGDLLEANIAGLHEARDAGDVRAQAAFAGEIAELATGIRSMLRVVIGERHRLRGHPS